MKLGVVFDFKFVKITIYTKVQLANWLGKTLWFGWWTKHENNLLHHNDLEKDSEVHNYNSKLDLTLFSIVH